MEKKQCVICGRKFTATRSQNRKKYCTSCAYDIKKLRSSEKYWREKDPESISHNYCRGRLQTILNQINNKQDDNNKPNTSKPISTGWEEV